MTVKTRKSFPVYLSWKDSIKLLSVEEKAQFLDNLFNFNSGEEIELNTPMLTMFWKSIEYNLKDAIEKYDAKVKTMKDNALSNPKLQKTQYRETKDPILETTIPNISSINSQSRLYNDNDNDNDNEKENDNVKDKVNVKAYETSSIPGRVKHPEKVIDSYFGPEVD
jgi:hypothetical protein